MIGLCQNPCNVIVADQLRAAEHETMDQTTAA